jgi:glycosyltransferase involved in cell wall biosynthesis
VEPWLREPQLTPAGFSARSDVLLVAGWLAGRESPNVDGLLWFAREVLPIVRARLPWVRVRVSGSDPPDTALEVEGRSISFIGHVSDMAALYGSTRACIVPLRYGSGVKIKTIEALQYGVPTVATPVGAEGIDFRGTSPLLVVGEPRQFAEALISVLTERVAWEAKRAEIELFEARRRSEAAPVTWSSILAEVVGARLGVTPRPERRAAI